MTDKPYSQFKESRDDLILRDYLAIERTLMANESSLLAYIRTSLTLLIAGVTFIHFFNDSSIWVFGWILVTVAAFLFVAGVHRYHSNEAALKSIVNKEVEEMVRTRPTVFKRLALATQKIFNIF